MSNYDLNLDQRKRMKGICKNDCEFSWQDEEFMNTLLGKLPPLRRYSNSTGAIQHLVWELEKVYKQYDAFTTNASSFLGILQSIIHRIKTIEPRWHDINLDAVERSIKQQKFCLVRGEGGIGKSYFVKCLEEQLTNHSIPHLCVYGKFLKTPDSIDFEEVSLAERFVLVIDAINEMTEAGQVSLVEKLRKLKQSSNCRIVITYRNKKLNEDILQQYQALAEDCYDFPGVSFESALDCLTQLSIPDVYLYEDILYSNNPLLLSILQKTLTSHKISANTLTSLLSITHILEQYIKLSIDRHAWENTKTVASWMYRNNKKFISHSQIVEILDDAENYIDQMLQRNLLISYLYQETEYFEFGLELLSDFLIARNLFNDLSNASLDKQIEIIKSKTEGIPHLEEAVIILLFSRTPINYQDLKLILEKTGLMNSFLPETLRKIRFNSTDIPAFRKVFHLNGFSRPFEVFAGYSNQPFNCTNHYNHLLLNDTLLLNKLSSVLAGKHFHGNTIHRLKNILYMASYLPLADIQKREAFWFSVWACAAPNIRIRNLATKLLYDIVSNDIEYQTKLISIFNRIHDLYIQDSIIFVLSKCPSLGTTRITAFFQQLIEDKAFLLSGSLSRISTYLGLPYDYINWSKDSLRDDYFLVPEEFHHLVLHVDLVDSSFFPFRYRNSSHIEMYNTFLDVKKEEVSQWNSELSNSFPCINPTSPCSGSLSFTNFFKNKSYKNYDEYSLDPTLFFNSFAKVAINTLTLYGVRDYSFGYEEFPDSLIKKCLDIAIDLTIGSFMCNYYSNEFGSYNTNQNQLGYEVYDPLAYHDELPIATPLPNYHNASEMLCDCIINRLELPECKDVSWVKNSALTRSNLMRFHYPIRIKETEWVMIAGRVSLQEYDANQHTLWRDTYTYWCCTSPEEKLCGTSKDRFLTIELEDFKDSISTYVACNQTPWLCKSIPSLGSDSFQDFDKTSIVLPPANLIRDLNLSLNQQNMTWINASGEIILYCNNSEYSYYTSSIGCTVFIRKDILDEYVKKHTLKYFAFSERYHPETGYADETAIHFEIENDVIVHEVFNCKQTKTYDVEVLGECLSCPLNFINEQNQAKDTLENIIFDLDYGTQDTL